MSQKIYNYIDIYDWSTIFVHGFGVQFRWSFSSILNMVVLVDIHSNHTGLNRHRICAGCYSDQSTKHETTAPGVFLQRLRRCRHTLMEQAIFHILFTSFIITLPLSVRYYLTPCEIVSLTTLYYTIQHYTNNPENSRQYQQVQLDGTSIRYTRKSI